jgi:Putative adhesin
MNRQIFSLLVLLLCSFTAAHATDERTEFTKKISRDFATTSDGVCALCNKYGKVEVRTWSENKVKIDVNIVVMARDQAEANRTFDKINVNFMSSYGYVKAETMITGGNSNWNWSWDGIWGSSSNACDYKINYEVYLPQGNNIELKNSYGDSFLPPFKGKLDADIKYGNLKVGEMSNDVDLNLAYGEANFRSMANLSADISYAKIFLDYAKAAQIETKYSELKVGNCLDLRIESMYDDMEIQNANALKVQTKYSNLKLGKIGSLYLTAQYTDAKIDALSESLDADMDYGDLRVSNLGDRFKSVQFFGNYCDFNLVPTGNTGYSFDLQGNNGDVTYPRAALVSTCDNSSTGKKVSGKVNGGGGAKIYAKVNYGDIRISN